MLHCPNCGREVSESENYCMNCGAELRKPRPDTGALPSQTYGFESPPLSDIREVLVRRFEGLRARDAAAIARCIDSDNYTKFDDWPPYRRQRREALKNEADALGVLSGYSFNIEDLDIDALDDLALTTFHLSYGGQIRRRPFSVRSRVTVVLRRLGNEWKIVHEHYSRFPTR